MLTSEEIDAIAMAAVKAERARRRGSELEAEAARNRRWYEAMKSSPASMERYRKRKREEAARRRAKKKDSR